MAPRTIAGAWQARWGAWQVYTCLRGAGWSVSVWRWDAGTSHTERSLLGKSTGQDSFDAAIAWACDVMKSHGAKVFVNGVNQPIQKFLFWTPAPEIT